jgi:CBS domain-containing protein
MVRNLAVHHGPRKDIDRWPVAAAMSQPAVALRSTATMGEALQALAVSGLCHLAVIDGEGTCVGLLTDRTVAAAWAAYPMTFAELPVVVVCTTQPTVNARASIADAARMMRRCESDAVVVVGDDRRPVGVLTAGDVIALLAKPRYQS